MDAELEFAIQPSTTGKQLFDQVCLCKFYISLFVMPNYSTDTVDAIHVYLYAAYASLVKLLNYKLFGMPAGFSIIVIPYFITFNSELKSTCHVWSVTHYPIRFSPFAL